MKQNVSFPVKKIALRVLLIEHTNFVTICFIFREKLFKLYPDINSHFRPIFFNQRYFAIQT